MDHELTVSRDGVPVLMAMNCVVGNQAHTARTSLVQTPAMHALVREQVVLLVEDALWLAFSGNWSCERGCVMWVFSQRASSATCSAP